VGKKMSIQAALAHYVRFLKYSEQHHIKLQNYEAPTNTILTQIGVSCPKLEFRCVRGARTLMLRRVAAYAYGAKFEFCDS
jgi:hypothetical protein